MNGAISPSIMCVDFMKLKETIDVFEEENIDYLHIDIMDGVFVPNYTLGVDFCKSLKKNTDIPLDIHLMINEPESKLEWFDFGENDIVSVHIEGTKHIYKAIQLIKERGAKAFVAINPGTPLSALESVTDIIDGILVMTVNPGFAGGKLIGSTLKKIEDAKAYMKKLNRDDVKIEVDGNVSFENSAKMKKCGADIFVAGTSSVFSKAMALDEAIKKLQKIVLD